MTITTTQILAAAAALAAGPAIAHAAPADLAPLPPAASYADLLQPIPNAMERLRAADTQTAPQEAELIEAQYYPAGPGPAYHHHHHHHHNRRWYIRNGYAWNGGAWVLRPVRHHHHHHHHNSY